MIGRQILSIANVKKGDTVFKPKISCMTLFSSMIFNLCYNSRKKVVYLQLLTMNGDILLYDNAKLHLITGPPEPGGQGGHWPPQSFQGPLVVAPSKIFSFRRPWTLIYSFYSVNT